MPFHTALFVAARAGRVWFARRAAAVGDLALLCALLVVAPAAAPAALAMVAVALAGPGAVGLVDRARAVQRRALEDLDRLRNKGDAVLAHVADGVVVTDAAGTIDEINQAAVRMFGCSREVATSRGCAEVLALHLGTRALDCSSGCALLAARATDEELGTEVWRRASDGRRQPLLANVSPIVSAEGEVVEIVHSLRDVTRLKQAEEAKTLFLATASHELKTPLTVIQGFAQTLLLNPSIGGEERQRALEAIERRAVQLAGIVDRLLLSSRIDAGRIEVATRPTDLGRVLTGRVGDFAAATGRQVEIELPAAAPNVLADETSLVTVIDHLLDNAAKYSPDDAPIAVTAVVHAAAVELAVRDEGIGMTPDQAANCFERFCRRSLRIRAGSAAQGSGSTSCDRS